MGQLSALFIGGTGTISSACVTVALDRGIELTVLNRGRTTERPLPRDVRKIDADIRDPGAVRAALGHREFDAVVDFVAFSPSHVDLDVELFTGRTGQYVFVSSASAYHKPVPRLPIVESTPLHNPYWGYSRAKISCEERLHSAYRDRGFPITIVRPSHTYDRISVPVLGGWTALERARRGLPVVVHGDGTSLWVLTHHLDLARAFVALLACPRPSGARSTSPATRSSPGTRSSRPWPGRRASIPISSTSPPSRSPTPRQNGVQGSSGTRPIR